MLPDRLPVRVSRVHALRCGAAASALACTLAGAQPAPAPAPPAPAAEMTPAERAQRDADKVFKWILIHSDKPRKPIAVREEKHDDRPAVAVRAKPAARVSVPGGAEPAPAPVVAAASSTPAAAPLAVTPVPATPEVAAPTVIETALASTASPAPRAALPSLPAPAPSDEADEVLQPLVRTDPKFPPNVLRSLTKGKIQVRFTVLPDGSVAEPSVVTTSDPRLRTASLAAVAQWRFAPLRKPQTGLVDLVFDFE